MTTIVNRSRRVIVQPVRPRVVTLSETRVARIAKMGNQVVTQPSPTNALVRPVNPVLKINNIGQRGLPGVNGSGAIAPIEFAFGDADHVVFTTPVAGIFTITRIEITQAFDGAGASIRVGTAGQPEALMSAAKNYPAQLASYEAASDFRVAANTGIILSISPGISPAQGAGTLYLIFTPEV